MGTGLDFFLQKVFYSIGLQHRQTRCFGHQTLRASCCKLKKFKKPCGNWAIETFSGFRAILYGGSMEEFWMENANLWSVIRDSGRLLYTRLQLSRFPRTTDRLLWTYWTAGIMARPPDIVPTSGNTIFHVLNRSSRCIGRPVWRLLGGFRKSLPIISWWLGRRRDVQLFFHEMYAASRLFCAHSAGLLKTYL